MDRKQFFSHLLELRSRLIRSLVVLVVLVVAMLPFAGKLFHILAYPILAQLPEGQQLISIGVAAPVFIPIKLVFVLGLALSMPYFLYQFWTFVASGLYKSERRLLWVLLIFSCILFYLGILFAYFVVFPLIFNFFISFVPAGVSATPDIGEYLSFSTKLFLAFGLAFEVPIAVIILLYAEITTVKQLKSYRPYMIVIAFVFGMLLTPPDIISQILLAIPICLLYQIGIWVGQYLVVKKKDTTREEV